MGGGPKLYQLAPPSSPSEAEHASRQLSGNSTLKHPTADWKHTRDDTLSAAAAAAVTDQLVLAAAAACYDAPLHDPVQTNHSSSG